ncbi:MAG: aminomethyl-transferring glycine dehydrogenase subunit GcvPB [Candidatus Aminicenantes bacterium]|nr:aminomethyl-transferring glycine dehydrogenase subunit GcvPB [Candidatus Aminicenantes bacterium]
MNKLPPLIFEKSRDGKIGHGLGASQVPAEPALDADLRRTEIADFPQVSEVEIVRHYMALARLNYSLDAGIYPLGSCTMKYNPKINEKLAAAEEFQAHPYAPHDLVQGNLELMARLEQWLVALTGLAGFTLAPAAGAHGEFTGMLIIRKFLQEQGDARRVVLIPDSAHGTNPSSAHFAGYEIREVPSNADGIIDVNVLQSFLDGQVAALMMTNPNTLGIFEKNITAIASALHANGSLLYMDGANLNALLGIVRPGDLGVDVMHINLHKTFSTPHGGGGPGSGPVGVASHLLPFLPVPRVVKSGDKYRVIYDNPQSIGRIKNFYGQFLVLIRALAYLSSLGRENIRRVAEDAVLNANYLRKRLQPLLDLPYAADTLHEVVFSDKNLPVKTLDIAKRLLDYGVHPFTIYFPLIVHGAMMIEPTETESKETLDEFIAIMEKILQEAREHPEQLLQAPQQTPVRRLDETLAARKPVLRWRKGENL